MSYELQVLPAPQALAAAFGGTTVEVRELTYGAMRNALRAGGEREVASEGLLGASLHVDGQPVGLDALLACPGRFSGDIAVALADCIELHGINRPPPGSDDTPKQ